MCCWRSGLRSSVLLSCGWSVRQLFLVLSSGGIIWVVALNDLMDVLVVRPVRRIVVRHCKLKLTEN
jgi:hypothetical protein